MGNRLQCTPAVLHFLLLLFVWYSAGSLGTITNKSVMTIFPFPVLLAVSHLVSGGVVDMFLLRGRKVHVPWSWELVLASVPVSLALTLTKTLTFVSYEKLSASLTHTIKSSGPVFSVLANRFVFGKLPARPTLASLLPISLGVGLSAMTDLEFEMTGFLAAVVATVANVAHSTYTKHVLRRMRVDPLVLHMYTSLLSLVLLLPYLVLKSGFLFETSAGASADHAAAVVTTAAAAAGLHGGKGLNLAAGAAAAAAGAKAKTSASAAAAAAAAAADLDDHALLIIPVFALLLSNFLHYLQNVSSLFVLSKVDVLSFQVVNTLKRAVVIAFSVVYFGNPVTTLNALGMLLALVGFFLYGIAKSRDPSSGKHGRGRKNSGDLTADDGGLGSVSFGSSSDLQALRSVAIAGVGVEGSPTSASVLGSPLSAADSARRHSGHLPGHGQGLDSASSSPLLPASLAPLSPFMPPPVALPPALLHHHQQHQHQHHPAEGAVPRFVSPRTAPRSLHQGSLAVSPHNGVTTRIARAGSVDTSLS